MGRKVAIVLFMAVTLGCANSNTKSDWKHPKIYEESILYLPDSLCSEEQREFAKVLNKYMLTPGILLPNDGWYDVAYDSTLADRLGIPYVYLGLMNEHMDLQRNNAKTQNLSFTHEQLLEMLDTVYHETEMK